MDTSSNVVEDLVVQTTNCGQVHVHVLGDHKHASHHAVFLTVHDFGGNGRSFDNFVTHPCLSEARPRSVWINFELPGQGPNSPDIPLSYKYPSLQEICDDLVEVLDQLKVQYVIGFGEGAGANILARFAMAHPTRVLGLILIHPTATAAGLSEWVKHKLPAHKIGQQNRDGGSEYLSDLLSKINIKNLQQYTDLFLSRNDISGQLKDHLTCDTLIICGRESPLEQSVVSMYTHMNPQKSSILIIDNVADVLYDSPEQVARALLLFCKGLGLLTSVSTPADRARISQVSQGGPARRRISMQEADLPRRQSTSSPPSGYGK
ncbi:hypothetical protein BV898_13924 [Hypsibius exemplaris]|uniref:Protein NDRG3 n=1 Tax=Hypsibius exemplaris TaxID=2072580 RepID=A0A1W0W9B2_HYPEX|nr:hypothetical protein BV898_13924 [Hypsibius exemplaris]